MITQKRKLGDVGEEIACRHLVGKGYKILQRNFTTRFGEIDIIANKGDTLSFIEVKTMKAGGLLRPEENLTQSKLLRFERAVRMYLVQRCVSEKQRWQMDTITILIAPQEKDTIVTHFEHINIR